LGSNNLVTAKRRGGIPSTPILHRHSFHATNPACNREAALLPNFDPADRVLLRRPVRAGKLPPNKIQPAHNHAQDRGSLAGRLELARQKGTVPTNPTRSEEHTSELQS